MSEVTHDFFSIIDERNAVIDASQANLLPQSDPVREVAALLHPVEQHLRVRSIKEWKNAKSFTLEPNPEKGTFRIAPYVAGQYLSLKLEIDGSKITRPYSISSGPIEAVKANAYTLTIKRSGGFAAEWILDNWNVGTLVTASAPLGTFSHNPVRDAKHVIAIAGGSGITPFRAMASAIADGYDDYNLTILYGSRTPEDILFKADFDEFMARSEKIKVVHVLSDVEIPGYEHGFINAGIIAKYIPKEPPFSFFICGPKGLYDFIGGQLVQLHMPPKYIRYELFGSAKNAKASGECYSLTVDIHGDKKSIPARADETILVALERAGIAAPSHCRSGVCGFCRSRLVCGEVVISPDNDGRRLADKKLGYIHPCATYPSSDLEIELQL